MAGPGYETAFGHVRTDEKAAPKADRLLAGTDYVSIPILSGGLGAGVDLSPVTLAKLRIKLFGRAHR